MPGLCDLPVELRTRIAEYVAEDDVSLLLNLALSCSAFREIAQSIIFRKWSYVATTKDRGINLEHNRFLQALSNNPTLARHLHTFRSPPPVSSADAVINGIIHGPIYNFRECEEIGKLIVAKAQNLKTLEIPYPYGCTFLDTVHPTLRELTVRPAGIHSVTYTSHSPGDGERIFYLPREGRLDIAFLSSLLRSPMLRALTIEAVEIFEEAHLDGRLLHSTSLEELYLCVGGMNTETVRALIQSSDCLKVFMFQPVEREDTTWHVLTDSGHLPAMQAILDSLETHHSSLQSLRLHCFAHLWHPNLHVNPRSLHTFSNLQSLDIDEPLLLGLRSCPHMSSPDGGNSTVLPAGLADLLPPSLKTLILRLDVLYDTRYGPKHATEIVTSLIEAQTCLPKFSSLTLSFPHVFCDQCEEDINIRVRAAPPPHNPIPAYGVNVVEAEEILTLMKDAKFSLRFLGNKSYWIGAVDGMRWHEPVS
ncbi:hypothetical protein H2198_009596 [Neophaeococcomyces mojaviensis]|uniref:Uncharacterized protein n=1 Tax=Neophaeococcomyces mojaviensis TaxID=3383035 RepID=A0ACC2ZU43_9EURO|nr:hypothetical protein H2198_009596 [Knufia sp. JES_112]